MLTDRNGRPMESEFKVRARAEAACQAELERIKASANDMPGWLRKTFIGRRLAYKRLMHAWSFQAMKADHMMSIDRTVGVPYQKLATNLHSEAMRVRHEK